MIGDNWTADYLRSDSFEGIAQFGQRGPNHPYRAVSRADPESLKRLSERAVIMPHEETWKIANRVADTFGIDRSRFETPQLTDEGLFNYRLGVQNIRYRKKGTDPVNQLNSVRDFSLRAT